METKLTVKISPELRRQAHALAALRGETISDVVRAALVEYIAETNRIKRDPQLARQTDPLLSMRFSGGPGDAAERVQEVLTEAADPIDGLRADE